MRLCASITLMLVGSPTMTARGRGRSAPSRAISGRTPVQPTSSSYETMMWIGSFSLRDLNSGTEASTQARKPFMSQVPRP